MPTKSKKYEWGMTSKQSELVLIAGQTFSINPWKIRDKILNKVENKKDIWDDEFAPLMKVFKVINP